MFLYVWEKVKGGDIKEGDQDQRFIPDSWMPPARFAVDTISLHDWLNIYQRSTTCDVHRGCSCEQYSCFWPQLIQESHKRVVLTKCTSSCSDMCAYYVSTVEGPLTCSRVQWALDLVPRWCVGAIASQIPPSNSQT